MRSRHTTLLAILFLTLPVSRSGAESVAAADSQQFPFVGLVTGDRVNLRTGPGMSYEVLLALPEETKLAVFSRVGEWYGVRIPESVPGYVSRDDVQVQGDRAVVRKDRVHVRAGASFSSTSLGMIGSEEQLQVRRSLEEWIEVRVPASCRAWVHGSYVKFLKPLDSKERVSDGHP